MSIFLQHHKGFSLVEVLVAISILLLVITGPMTMISRSNNSTAFATEQITAFFLAQEGLELVQKQRDDILLKNGPGTLPNTSWTEIQTYFQDCDVDITPEGCSVEIESGNNPSVTVVDDCSPITNCRLRIDSALTPSTRPSYRHSGSDPLSLFTRVITMDFDPSLREVKVTATVTWRTGSLIRQQEVVSVTYLFNVYQTS